MAGRLEHFRRTGRGFSTEPHEKELSGCRYFPAGPVLQDTGENMLPRTLNEQEFDDLSAFRDGELSPARRAEIETLLAGDPAWQAAGAELANLDALLDRCPAPPPADPAMASRILQKVRAARPGLILRLVRYAAPVAAAAGILVGIAVWKNLTLTPEQAQLRQDNRVLNSVKEDDRIIVENLDFFRDYEVVANYETLEALDQVEATEDIY